MGIQDNCYACDTILDVYHLKKNYMYGNVW